MQRFQLLVVVLLVAIIVELAVVIVKLPTPIAEAQERRPVPVVLVDPGLLDCVPLRECARVDSGGVLRVSVFR